MATDAEKRNAGCHIDSACRLSTLARSAFGFSHASRSSQRQLLGLRIAAHIMPILRILLLLLVTTSVCSAGQDPGLVIHSISGPSTGTDEVSIVVEYSYDGAHGDAVMAGARSISRGDFVIQSNGFRPKTLVKGNRLKQTFLLSRPPREAAFRTDAVDIFAYVGGGSYVARKLVDHSVEWAAVSSLHSYDYSLLDGFAMAFVVGDHAEAERVFEVWSKLDAIDASGNQMLMHYMETTRSNFRLDREGSIAKIRAWRSTRPNSVAAIFTEAWFWIAYAEHLHGWKEPDADTLSVIRQYQAKAAAILNKTKPLTGKHPLWPLFQLKMATNAELGEKEVMRAFEVAVHGQPTYPQLYIEATRYLAKRDAPGRWRVINEIADRLDKAVAATNPGAYADLMDHAAGAASSKVLDPFTTGLASWPRTRDSWKALTERYPSAYNLNRFASKACQAYDKETFNTVYGKIGKRIALSAWPHNLSPDLCRHRFLKES